MIQCLIDSFFKICNNSNSFNNDTENIESNLIKNAYPFLINKVIKKYLGHKFSSYQNQLKNIKQTLITDTRNKNHFLVPESILQTNRWLYDGRTIIGYIL